MAERRMLHRKASVSTDLADLREKHGGDALAFYLLMIPHMDRWGCVPDNAVTLRAMVCPTWDDITTADIKAWLSWIVKRGMLERIVGPGGDKGLRSPEFHDHQRGTEFQKEAPSRFEPADITKRWVREGRKPRAADLAEKTPPRPQQVKWTRDRIIAQMAVEPDLSNRDLAALAGVSEATVRRVRQGASSAASPLRHDAPGDARHDAEEPPDLQGGRRPVGDQSPTRSVRREGKNYTPSPTPSPKAGAATAPPPPSPGAGAEPDADTNGHRHNDDLEHAATTARTVLERLRTRQEATP